MEVKRKNGWKFIKNLLKELEESGWKYFGKMDGSSWMNWVFLDGWNDEKMLQFWMDGKMDEEIDEEIDEEVDERNGWNLDETRMKIVGEQNCIANYINLRNC